jgi:hypothetical protein
MNDIFIKLQLGCRPVAVVQYTFTHKQYTEGNKTNNVQNNTTFFGRVRTVPHLCELYPGICFTTEEKARKKNLRYICISFSFYSNMHNDFIFDTKLRMSSFSHSTSF